MLSNQPPGVKKAKQYAIDNLGDLITLTDLAQLSRTPENTLTRYFNRNCGMSPIRWVWHLRTVVAGEQIMKEPRTSLTEIAMFCGFNSSAHFSRRFRAMFGVAPRTFRQHFLLAQLRPQTETGIAISQRYRTLLIERRKELHVPLDRGDLSSPIPVDLGCPEPAPM